MPRIGLVELNPTEFDSNDKQNVKFDSNEKHCVILKCSVKLLVCSENVLLTAHIYAKTKGTG